MVDPRRIRAARSGAAGSGPVLWWPSRDLRVEDNWALLKALAIAADRKVPVVAVCNLEPGASGGALRQHDFKVRGLRHMAQDLERLGIPFFVEVGERSHRRVADRANELDAAAIVTDFSPLRRRRRWADEVSRAARCPVLEVDAHNVVPPWVVTDRREQGARTLRPKLARLLPEFLVPFPEATAPEVKWAGESPRTDWDAVLRDPRLDQTVLPVGWAEPGAKAGRHRLATFVRYRLDGYATHRNDPNEEGQSGLSPYLHYGFVAPARAALEVLAATGRTPADAIHPSKNASADRDGAAAFLEELIVRRELAENFCLHEPKYDSIDAFPEWAKKSLERHRKDARLYSYSRTSLEHGLTHDELWNAAQAEVRKTGRMHGYLRMYWAKKILEWSDSPAHALATAIYLNDRYQLDGRDPNGYAGIAWSIGGVHDRPWYERQIFGLVRPMAESGAKKKFDVEAYCRRWLGEKPTPKRG
jgi:deoxyribodipyrimidine photo-lyase